ncbi:Fe2+-dependent dioxygenase [Allohahella marinimesophila]|uniref:Fe2+-dependent dioxygenase n=1 Tax=Allohahella marinimesophila TaxID=1054972 RepID=A0ABP7NQL9_9GAMM
MLIDIPDLLSNSEVIAFRERLAGAEWIDGRKTAGSQARGVKSNLQLDDDAPLAKELSTYILRKLGSHPTFLSAALPHSIFPPRFNCYQQGGAYGLHVDNAIMALPDQGLLRSDISATLFLSDPDAYEGGELMIEGSFGAQQVKLESGSLILYPASSLHEVRPVISGRREAAFFWVQSMVREHHQREQLFELDQAIQVLSSDRGSDNHEVRRLSALYHNLLRSWSIV